MGNPARVALIDDHHIVRRGLRMFLESYADLVVVGEAASGEEALQQIERWLPDVVVVDLLLPGGMDGIETLRRIHHLYPAIHMVALTSSPDAEKVLAALHAGALGYVRKDALPETLLNAIRAAARGQSTLDVSVTGAVIKELTSYVRPEDPLTEREREVLHLLAQGRTNPEIAESLAISNETVKTHVTKVLAKLRLSHRLQAVVYALKHGLISLDEIDV